MNVADSNELRSILERRGFTCENSPRSADLIIVNTCSVRENAEIRAKARIKEFAGLKKKNARIWVTGCMAQRLGEKLIEEIPGVNRVIGAKQIEDLESIVDDALATTCGFTDREFSNSDISDFVSIMRGCNNYCAYCIVPYVRGAEKSIPAGQILNTIQEKVNRGIKEITLLGQNVNSYDDNGTDFPDLLQKAASIDNLQRIRFTTSHPKDVSEKLISTMAANPLICRHIHLPVQAGSDRILSLMNRKYTSSQYLAKIEMIRRYMPDADITTDILVGFPSETEEEFRETLSLAENVRYTTAFMFAYSVREGTAAAKMSDNVPREEKLHRLNRLIEQQTRITKEIYNKNVGKELQILVTGRQEKKDRLWMGQDRGCKRVLLSCDEMKAGMIFKARVIRSSGMTLICERIL